MSDLFQGADALAQAQSERQEAWMACVRGRITQAQLWEILQRLREIWGQRLYDRPRRR